MRALMDGKSSHGVELGMRPNGVLGFDIVTVIDKLNLISKKVYKRYEYEMEGITQWDGRT
jgi:hypothetical protein